MKTRDDREHEKTSLEGTTGTVEDVKRSRPIQPDRLTILHPSVKRRLSLLVDVDGALDEVLVRAYDQIVVKEHENVVCWGVLIAIKGKDPV